MERYDKVAFPEAVRQLAVLAGLTGRSRKPRSRMPTTSADSRVIAQAHEIAAVWFTEQLAAAVGARHAVNSRNGRGDDLARTMALGYAPAMPMASARGFGKRASPPRCW